MNIVLTDYIAQVVRDLETDKEFINSNVNRMKDDEFATLMWSATRVDNSIYHLVQQLNNLNKVLQEKHGSTTIQDKLRRSDFQE